MNIPSLAAVNGCGESGAYILQLPVPHFRVIYSNMKLGNRLKTLRQEVGLSQAVLGQLGFVSTPGWIKIENGQRFPSDPLIDKLIKWMVENKHLRTTASKELREELLTLKYMTSNKPFLRDLAKEYAATLPNGAALVAKTPEPKPTRGRPRKS